MTLAPLSAGFQSLSPLPKIKLGPSGADSQVGGLVYILGPCLSLQWTLLWGWEFFPLPQSPQVFSITFWFSGFISLHWNPGLHVLSCSGVVPPSLSACECGTARSTSCHLTGSALLARWSPVRPAPQSAASPGPPAAPLLQVLSAQLLVSTPPPGLDECFFINSLVVGLPYSWIFCQFWLILFLNCCCPSFGCVRKQSVSSYASILARSPENLFCIYFPFFLTFIGVTLVNKIKSISVVHFYDTWSIYCTVYPPPKIKSSFVTIYLAPFTHLLPPHSLSFGSQHTVVCGYKFQFYFPHMSEIIWFLAFFFLLILLSIIFSRSIHVVTNSSISFFSYDWVVFHSTCVPHCI